MLLSIRLLLIVLFCAMLAGNAHAQTLSDDTGRAVALTPPAQRIVSLAPHITELLFVAGAGAHVVGVDSASDYPAAALTLPRVGRHNHLDLEAVVALQPDLVIAWAGNRHSNLDRLAALGIPLYISESHQLEDIARAIETFGQLAGTEDVARTAAEDFRQRLAALNAQHSTRPPVRVFYQIWNQPLMTINDQHTISAAIRTCGGRNVFGDLAVIAPRISLESVLAADADVIIASGTDTARPEWLDMWRDWPSLRAVRHDHLYAIHPDLIQRHTPRILDGTEELCAHLEAVRAARGDPPI